MCRAAKTVIWLWKPLTLLITKVLAIPWTSQSHISLNLHLSSRTPAQSPKQLTHHPPYKILPRYGASSGSYVLFSHRIVTYPYWPQANGIDPFISISILFTIYFTHKRQTLFFPLWASMSCTVIITDCLLNRRLICEWMPIMEESKVSKENCDWPMWVSSSDSMHLKDEDKKACFDTSYAAAAAKLLQSCPTLCDTRDGSPPGFPVPGILQARTLEWVAISFSNAWKWKVKVKSLSRISVLATPWTVAYQAPPFMGFSRQEYCSGMPLPSPWYLLYPFPNGRWTGLRIQRLKRRGLPGVSWTRLTKINRIWMGNLFLCLVYGSTLFFLFLAMPHSLQDLSFTVRDRTQALGSESTES